MRGEVCVFTPVNSPVATFEQSENVAIAHLAACNEGCGYGIIDSLPSVHAHCTIGHFCTGRILFVSLYSLWFVSMYC